MKNIICLLLLSCICFITNGTAEVLALADNPFLGEPRFEKILRFSDGRGYMVEVVPNGTVLVPKGQDATFKQKIMKSTDGGDIWTTIDIRKNSF